jgi:hypothetical protein
MHEEYMPTETGSILVGRFYLTHSNSVRRVLEVDGKTVTDVVRGKLAFPSWDKTSWPSASRRR